VSCIPCELYVCVCAGAVAFNLCTKSPCSDIIRGAILVAPMLKIAEEMMIVPRFVVDFLRSVVIPCVPYAPLAPVKDVLPNCYKTEKIYMQSREHSLHFDMKPRLGTFSVEIIVCSSIFLII
jgi:hypothetical protein